MHFVWKLCIVLLPYGLVGTFWVEKIHLVIFGILHKTKHSCDWKFSWLVPMNMENFIIILIFNKESIHILYIDSLSKRDQMRRAEVTTDKDKVESVLYQTVANKRLRELCIYYWYLSESINWPVVRAFLKITQIIFLQK